MFAFNTICISHFQLCSWFDYKRLCEIFHLPQRFSQMVALDCYWYWDCECCLSCKNCRWYVHKIAIPCLWEINFYLLLFLIVVSFGNMRFFNILKIVWCHCVCMFRNRKGSVLPQRAVLMFPGQKNQNRKYLYLLNQLSVIICLFLFILGCYT